MYGVPSPYKISHASSNGSLIITIERKIKYRFQTRVDLYSAKLWLHKLVPLFVFKDLLHIPHQISGSYKWRQCYSVSRVHVAMISPGWYQVLWKYLGSQIIRLDRQMDMTLVITWSCPSIYRKENVGYEWMIYSEHFTSKLKNHSF
jgi:hypothetical protein